MLNMDDMIPVKPVYFWLEMLYVLEMDLLYKDLLVRDDAHTSKSHNKKCLNHMKKENAVQQTTILICRILWSVTWHV